MITGEVNQHMDTLHHAKKIVAKVVNKKEVKSEEERKQLDDRKRTQRAQANRCVQLFRDFGGEPSGMAVTPAEGVFQITDISNIDESFWN